MNEAEKIEPVIIAKQSTTVNVGKLFSRNQLALNISQANISESS